MSYIDWQKDRVPAQYSQDGSEIADNDLRFYLLNECVIELFIFVPGG